MKSPNSNDSPSLAFSSYILFNVAKGEAICTFMMTKLLADAAYFCVLIQQSDISPAQPVVPPLSIIENSNSIRLCIRVASLLMDVKAT